MNTDRIVTIFVFIAVFYITKVVSLTDIREGDKLMSYVYRYY